MTTILLDSARPLGSGKIAPAGAIVDRPLLTLCKAYRKRVIGNVFSFTPAELDTYLPRDPVSVTPLVAGQTWFLVLGDGDPFLLGASGEVIVGPLPLLEEARRGAIRAQGRTIVAGQLYARPTSGRPRADDLVKLLCSGEQADVERLQFAGHDLLLGGDRTAQMPLASHAERAAVVARLFDGGRALLPARLDQAQDGERVLSLFREWIGGSLASALLLRTPSGRLLKLAPAIGLEAVVVAFTERPGEQVGSTLLALTRPDGQHQIVGACSILGDEASRRKLLADLEQLVVPSAYHHAGAHGELYKFVSPMVVLDVRAADILTETVDGRPLRSAVLSFSSERWDTVAFAPTLQLVAPSLAGRVSPKQAPLAPTRFAQVIEHAFVPGADHPVGGIALPASELLRREVWVKETRGQRAVRKLVAWRTNKSALDSAYPPYVVHWTDYSPGRKAPLEREVHPAASIESMNALADRLIAEHIKKGWERAGR